LPSPCHLLLVTNTLARGGAEAMLVRLATALDPTRVRPVVICFREPGVWAEPLLERKIPVHQGLLRHKYDAFVIRRLSRLVRQYPHACLMAVGSGGDRMFWSTLAARVTGVPMIVWSHLFPVPGEPEFEWINRRLYPWVHAVVALGRRHADALVDAAEARRGRVRVIRNGIDVDAFDHAKLRDAAREQLGLQPHEPAVGMVANLRPIKRVGLFLDAAAHVLAARPQTRFFVIGDGPQRDELQARIDGSPSLRATIHFLGAREDVPTLMQAFDIVCLTSLRECLSVAMLEAMAAGKAFVAPRVGSLDEALIDGQTGRFFEPETADALAGVLIELIDDPAQRTRLGNAARAKVRSEFRLERMAREFEDLVTELCATTVRCD